MTVKIIIKNRINMDSSTSTASSSTSTPANNSSANTSTLIPSLLKATASSLFQNYSSTTFNTNSNPINHNSHHNGNALSTIHSLENGISYLNNVSNTNVAWPSNNSNNSNSTINSNLSNQMIINNINLDDGFLRNYLQALFLIQANSKYIYNELHLNQFFVVVN